MNRRQNREYFNFGEGLNEIKDMAIQGKNINDISKHIGITRETLRVWRKNNKNLDKIIECKGHDGVEYKKEPNVNGNRYSTLFVFEGKEVKYCSKCNDFFDSAGIGKDSGWCNRCKAKHSRAYRRTPQGKLDKKRSSLLYYKENKDYMINKVRERQTNMTNNAFNYNNEMWELTLKEFNNECAYCGEEDERMEREHVIPVSKGGAYIKSNIVPSCRSCNRSKSAKDFEEWYVMQDSHCETRHNKINEWTNTVNNAQQLTLL